MESLVTQLETLTVGLQTVLQNRDLGGGKPSLVGPQFHNHNAEYGEVHLKSIKLDFPKFDAEDNLDGCIELTSFLHSIKHNHTIEF